MRYFFDTEFIEDGRTIDLISIGIVAEDGREFYAVSNEVQLHLANDWVRANVLPHLPAPSDPAWMSRRAIRNGIWSFLGGSRALPGDPKPELWAYYADYDWVAFCQLWGRMIDLPSFFPKFCMDLKQWSVMLGSPAHPKQAADEHHALADARWNRQLHRFLTGYSRGLP